MKPDLIIYNAGDRAYEFGECTHCGREIEPNWHVVNRYKESYQAIYPFSCSICWADFNVILDAEEV